jgi:hypothetical protein
LAAFVNVLIEKCGASDSVNAIRLVVAASPVGWVIQKRPERGLNELKYELGNRPRHQLSP